MAPQRHPREGFVSRHWTPWTDGECRLYARAVGNNLRLVRKIYGWSLADVSRESGGRWSSVTVGSYERADRAVTVTVLLQLCGFYGVEMALVVPAGLKAAASGRPDPDLVATARLAADGRPGTIAGSPWEAPLAASGPQSGVMGEGAGSVAPIAARRSDPDEAAA
jgi:transcriptional regulator with XRE-family HTH domain